MARDTLKLGIPIPLTGRYVRVGRQVLECSVRDSPGDLSRPVLDGVMPEAETLEKE